MKFYTRLRLIFLIIFANGTLQASNSSDCERKAAKRTTLVIDFCASQREGENFVAKMQWETKSRQADETWHDDSLLDGLLQRS